MHMCTCMATLDQSLQVQCACAYRPLTLSPSPEWARLICRHKLSKVGDFCLFHPVQGKVKPLTSKENHNMRCLRSHRVTKDTCGGIWTTERSLLPRQQVRDGSASRSCYMEPKLNTCFTRLSSCDKESGHETSPTSPSILKVHLKLSKMDQFRKGMDVYMGKMDDGWWPIRLQNGAYITVMFEKQYIA